jgi:hypothetical protein
MRLYYYLSLTHYTTGGEINGNGSRLLLRERSLSWLEAHLPAQLSQYAHVFRCLDRVVEGCYGYDLAHTFKEDIARFKQAYLELKISVTPKVHIIMEHIR